jgi:hypothetical protein
MTCLFKFTVLYFLIVNFSEGSIDLLSLAASTFAHTQIIWEKISTSLFHIVPFRYCFIVAGIYWADGGIRHIDTEHYIQSANEH